MDEMQLYGDQKDSRLSDVGVQQTRRAMTIGLLNTAVLSLVFEFVDKHVVFTRTVSKTWYCAARRLGRRMFVQDPTLLHSLVLDEQWNEVVTRNVESAPRPVPSEMMPLPLCSNCQVTDLYVRHALRAAHDNDKFLWTRLGARFRNIRRLVCHFTCEELWMWHRSVLRYPALEMLQLADAAFPNVVDLEFILSGGPVQSHGKVVTLTETHVFCNAHMTSFPKLQRIKTNIPRHRWNSDWGKTLTSIDMPVSMMTYGFIQGDELLRTVTLRIDRDAKLEHVITSEWLTMGLSQPRALKEVHLLYEGPDIELLFACLLVIGTTTHVSKVHFNNGQVLLLDSTRLAAFCGLPDFGQFIQDCPTQLAPGAEVDSLQVAKFRKSRPMWRNFLAQ
jgi:hypothetical protein